MQQHGTYLQPDAAPRITTAPFFCLYFPLFFFFGLLFVFSVFLSGLFLGLFMFCFFPFYFFFFSGWGLWGCEVLRPDFMT